MADSTELEIAVEKILRDYYGQVNRQLEKGLDRAADRLVQELERSPLTPDNPKTTTNKYRKSFRVKRKYKKHRYVGSIKTVRYNGSDVPLSSILEYGENGKPHLRLIFDGVEEELKDIIIDTMKENW